MKLPLDRAGGRISIRNRNRMWMLSPVLALLGAPAAVLGQASAFPDELSAGRAGIMREEQARTRSARMQALRSARSHARLRPSVDASQAEDYCPVYGSASVSGRRKDATPRLVARHAVRTTRWARVAPPTQSAAAVFRDYVSEPVVQSRCVNCHVEGGVSGHTRLVLSQSSAADHEKLNVAVFRYFLETVEDGANRILNKIQGVGHGGGIQVPAGSADFANMERFLRLLGGDSSVVGPSPETLFQGVTMASPARTLRRAALVFAGRIPTQAEINAVSDGRISSLRRGIRNLMAGPGFHEFLIRASNDRLLTDRHLGSVRSTRNERYFVDLANIHWELAKAAVDRGHEDYWNDPIWREWHDAVQYGLARAPLELIAYVIERDWPYTEILTADYIMANPYSARAYGANTWFANFRDANEFRPSRIVTYYRQDESKIILEDPREIGNRILNPGYLSTDYPHAGILNTTVFLLRYPTTATNRNRARARWTYYHFLGLDVEKSASRTIDPAALADTDNPTMKNPACTVCHRILDPVAGVFQNYGEEGLYRDNWGGRDSLAGLYKYGEGSPYRQGDTWYRDMREPGFGDRQAPDADHSVQWLARRIAADPRFAESVVKFWWRPVLGVDVTAPPEDELDRNFQAQLLASTAQSAETARIAAAFRIGIAGGRPFNGKDLLVEIALSPWFRAESVAGEDRFREAALLHAGVERLLTPEELANKTGAITGYVWGRSFQRGSIGGGSHLDRPVARSSPYELLYGGIDSNAVPVRTAEMTPLMAAVATSHAIEVSCPVVQREFFFLPNEKRLLFSGTDIHVTPDTEAGADAIRSTLVRLHRKLLGVGLAPDAPDIEAAFRLFVEVWERKRRTGNSGFQPCWPQDYRYFEGIQGNTWEWDSNGWARLNDRGRDLVREFKSDPSRVARTWVVVLSYLLTDYRYLHL